MKAHTKIYFDYFGLTIADFVSCEICGDRAVDIHHIECRGMGGSKTKDYIENLQAVCRACHNLFGDKVEYKEKLKEVHLKFMQVYGKSKH
jgi:hypothetical protein